MNGLEICLVIIGLVIIAVSFVFAEHFKGNDVEEKLLSDGKFSEVAQDIIRKQVEAELSMIVDDKLEEAKKELTKVSSEKILAMGEYSEDINLRISKNHEEVMFLYNMLNDKETVVKNTIKDIEALKVSVKKMAIVNDMSSGVAVNTTNSNVEMVANTELEKKISSEQVEEKLDRELEKVEAQAKEQAKELINESAPTDKKSKISVKTSNNNKKILELYSKGMSNIEIAKKLGLGVGEVRLVIDLFNSKK